MSAGAVYDRAYSADQRRKIMFKEIGPGFRLTLVFTILTGLIYPA